MKKVRPIQTHLHAQELVEGKMPDNVQPYNNFCLRGDATKGTLPKKSISTFTSST